MRKVTTTYFCDKCGKEIQGNKIPVFILEHKDRESADDYTTRLDSTVIDVCTFCKTQILEFIRQNTSQTPQKREFDVGKAQALRDAGWTYKAISEEMKCSEQTVWNKLNKKAGDKDAENEA